MEVKEAKESKTILLVDDDIDFLYQEEMLLREIGHKVITCDSLRKAKGVVAAGGFDLAVVDLMMEEMDAGLTLAYEIKKKNKNTPVIMVTAVSSHVGIDFSSLPNKEKAWVFADKVLAKPVRMEQLKKEIHFYLGQG
jgi:CheY-like chemotaxis protein